MKLNEVNTGGIIHLIEGVCLAVLAIGAPSMTLFVKFFNFAPGPGGLQMVVFAYAVGKIIYGAKIVKEW